MKPIYRLLIGLTLLASLHHACGQVSFSPSTIYGVSGPYSAVAVDVNGDGKLDLVCSNPGSIPSYNNNTLTVLTNNGSGVFASNATLMAGSGPVSVVAADVNNDGKMDLICASARDSSLSVFTNNGSGGFVLSSSPVIGASPDCVIAVDINGDGNMDLICPNNTTLSVLTNDGSGGFGFNATLNVVTGYPVSVVAADVNGDGKPDLICANAGFYPNYGNTLTVFTNNGNGEFGSNATLNVGNNPTSVKAADVNGDGKLDLICANQIDNTLSILTNNGSGGFVLASSTGVDYDPVSVVATDINGDGKLDLICANGGYYPNYFGTVSILTNNGSGVFGSNNTYAVGISPKTLIAADVNGDGKMDFVCSDYGNDRISVLINTSTFPSPTSKPSLKIKHSGNGMLVSWPSVSAGWSLQQNPDLTTTDWSPSGYNGFPIADDGTNKSLIITLAKENAFFRLLHP